MAAVICAAVAVPESGKGLRFNVCYEGETLPAFVIRFQGQVYAYLNQCAHQALELDWNEGDFFDREAKFLICATHGARYYPNSGACAGGRCHGVGLTKLAIIESDAQICLLEQAGVSLIDTSVPDGAKHNIEDEQ